MVEAEVYRSGTAVVLTVVNGGPRTVFTEDQKTDCSIVMLERWDGRGWVALSNCGAERAPRVVPIEPAERSRVVIDTGSPNFAEDPAGSGSYRAVVGFRYERVPEGSEPEQAVSSTFAIG
jgi:hypothetical protein